MCPCLCQVCPPAATHAPTQVSDWAEMEGSWGEKQASHQPNILNRVLHVEARFDQSQRQRTGALRTSWTACAAVAAAPAITRFNRPQREYYHLQLRKLDDQPIAPPVSSF